MQRNRTVGGALAALILGSAAQAARGDTINTFINWWPSSNLYVRAINDSVGDAQNTVYIQAGATWGAATVVDYHDGQTVTAPGAGTYAQTTAMYNFGQSGFYEQDSGYRPGTPSSANEVRTTLVFELVGPTNASPVAYTLSGGLTALGTQDLILEASLMDITPGLQQTTLFANSQESRYGESGSFTLGQTAGAYANQLQGNLSDVLQVNHLYQFYFREKTAVKIGSDNGGDFSGGYTLALGSPAAASPTPLPHTAVAGAALLGGYGVLRVIRRRRANAS